MDQRIRFCTTDDGVRIAYATLGQGAPIVVMPAWVTHLQFDWDDAVVRAFWEQLASRRTVVRFDRRGTGLSDRDTTDLSMDTTFRDLNAVVDAMAVERFALLGYSESGAAALTYAASNPLRVSALILCDAYDRWPHARELTAALLTLTRAQWGSGSPTLAAMYGSMGLPVPAERFTELQRVAASTDAAVRIAETCAAHDVSGLLPSIEVPTLVIHHRDDPAAPFESGREMARLIPGARFHPLDGYRAPAVFADRERVTAAVDSFLRDVHADRLTVPTSGMHTIFFTDLEGSTGMTQRLGDEKAQEVVRVHNTVVRDALRAHEGMETKHTGDGIMASFSSASHAVECAIEVQRALSLHNATSDRPIRVRIGLNAGEPVAEESDLFGTVAQLARRLCDRAAPGQILVSNVVRELVAGKGLVFSDLGRVTLKGFRDSVRVYAVQLPPTADARHRRTREPSRPNAARSEDTARSAAAGAAVARPRLRRALGIRMLALLMLIVLGIAAGSVGAVQYLGGGDDGEAGGAALAAATATATSIPVPIGGGAPSTAIVARVQPDVCANQRVDATTSSRILQCLVEGTRIKLEEGPRASDGRNWWFALAANEVTGWMAEDFLLLSTSTLLLGLSDSNETSKLDLPTVDIQPGGDLVLTLALTNSSSVAIRWEGDASQRPDVYLIDEQQRRIEPKDVGGHFARNVPGGLLPGKTFSGWYVFALPDLSYRGTLTLNYEGRDMPFSFAPP